MEPEGDELHSKFIIHANQKIMRSDLQIQQDVMTQLKWEPALNSANIGVSVKKGIVTLSGQVDSYFQKVAAENAAKKITGVRAIAEDIQIGISPYFSKTDSDIADTVLHSLKWHSAVPEDDLKIKVEDGIVTLEGEVAWDYQRTSAKNAVASLLGVKNVINNIKVQSRISATDVKSKISAAFHRVATIDSDKITIEVEGTKVILRGKVRSYAEKEDAIHAAWCAPGITSVVSFLETEPQMEFSL